MSLFSSLDLFYPGIPPLITAAGILRLGLELRESAGVRPDSRVHIQLKYGEKIDQDYEDTSELDIDEELGIGRIRHVDWDYEQDSLDEISKDLSHEQRHLYRGYFSLGSLTSETSKVLTRWSEENARWGICPDGLSLDINPVCPSILSDRELVCTGLVSASFSGNGFFSWGPTWKEYADQYQHAAPVAEALRVTRSLFPVPQTDLLERLAEHLGERFLNKDYYEPGDWILSVSESG